MKNIIPKRAKKASEMARLDAEKRGLRNSRTSSIGCGERSCQRANAPSASGGGGEAGEHAGVGPAAVGRLDDRPHERDQAGGREREAGQVERRGGGVARLGHERPDERQRGDDERAR